MTTEPTSMRIDIVSDVVCPWCIIGFKQLERALSQLEATVQSELHWHPFELNPHMPAEGQDLREHMAWKYGTTVEQSRAARRRLTQIGESIGFPFRFEDGMRIYNTYRAHQLLHWAGEQEKQTELELALFKSYFSLQENVDTPEALIAAAGRAGLDEEQAEAVLSDGRHADAVRELERFWLSKGIHAVPSFILDRRYLIPGAQEPDVFVSALNRLLDEQAG